MKRDEILAAREELVKAANHYKVRQHRSRPALSIASFRHPRLLGPRQWQEALGVCRRNKLVSADVLARATGKVKQ